MLQPIRCDFLTGSLTDQASMEGLVKDLDSQTANTHELLYYKKNGTALWLEVDSNNILTYLNLVACSFID